MPREESTVPPAMPGEAAAATSPDEAVNETLAVSAGAAQVKAIDPATATTPGDPALWRAGTLVYTSSGIAILFFWLLFGDFALSMRDRSVTPTVQLFLKSLNASNFTLSMLMTFLPPAIGLIVGPIVSYRSDRLRSRWGRRIPFLLIPTPVAALSMIAIAFSPQLGGMLRAAVGGDMHPDTATLVVFAVAWTIFEVAIIVSGSVLGGLINDVVPRGRLGRFYGLFRSISLLDGVIFNIFLISFAKTHFTLMFALIAIIFGVGFTLMCLKVREGEYPPPQANSDDPRAGGFIGAARVYFRECFALPYYRWCFAAFTLGALSFLPVNSFSVYYAEQLKMDTDLYGDLIGYSFIVSICTAYGIGWLVDRYHALQIGMVMMALYAISSIYGMTFIHDAPTFGVALVAHTILSGAYFTSTASLAAALLPRAKFAQFASAGGMVTSLTTMAVGPSLGFVLDRTGSNYRLTFVAGLCLSAAALAVMAIVYRQFMARGGPQGYVAPGDIIVPGTVPPVAAPRH